MAGIKRRLTPLGAADLVTAKELAKLRSYSISSVEELVGALGAQRTAVASLLGLSSDEAAELERKARDALPSHVRSVYEKVARVDFEPSFGARIERPED